MTILAFADSHGRWHAPCSLRHPGALRFGPTGISAPISKRAAHRLLTAGARLSSLPDGVGGPGIASSALPLASGWPAMGDCNLPGWIGVGFLLTTGSLFAFAMWVALGW